MWCGMWCYKSDKSCGIYHWVLPFWYRFQTFVNKIWWQVINSTLWCFGFVRWVFFFTPIMLLTQFSTFAFLITLVHTPILWINNIITSIYVVILWTSNIIGSIYVTLLWTSNIVAAISTIILWASFYLSTSFTITCLQSV
jgi:hypothetical protein